jgi:hypothetical protein
MCAPFFASTEICTPVFANTEICTPFLVLFLDDLVIQRPVFETVCTISLVIETPESRWMFQIPPLADEKTLLGDRVPVIEHIRNIEPASEMPMIIGEH